MMRTRTTIKQVVQWAAYSNTFSEAGTSSGSASLNAGQTGQPLVLRGSGSVSGSITLNFGNGAQLILPVNPNAPYSEISIPSTGFPFPVNAVSVTITADGAGTIRALVGFGSP